MTTTTSPSYQTTPYTSLVRILVTYNDGTSIQASGTLVNQDTVLTASHVVLNPLDHSTIRSVEIDPDYDVVNGQAQPNPYGSFQGVQAVYFNNFTPLGSGNISPNDGAASLGGSELDVALLTFSNPTGIQLPTSFALSGAFTQGVLNLTGYPADHNGTLTQTTVSASKDGSQNSITTVNGALNKGASGGPAWAYVNGVPTEFGVISTISSDLSQNHIADLSAHMNWISQFLQDDVLYRVGTAGNDIFHPYVPEFFLTTPAGLTDSYSTSYFANAGIDPLFNVSINGGGGTDTIALPWNSLTSAFSSSKLGNGSTTAPSWELTWTKSASGDISGTLQIDSYEMTFDSIEKVAFSNGILDLTTAAVGTQNAIGSALSETIVTSLSDPTAAPKTVATVLDTKSANPVLLHISTLAGDDAANELDGSSGDDVIYGLGGDDNIAPGLGNDVVDGGTGNDTLLVDYSASSGAWQSSFTAGTVDGNKGTIRDNAGDSVAFDDIENFDIGTGSGNDFLFGGSGNDILSAGGGNNVIAGGAGNDIINSTGAQDLILAGVGSDEIELGSGAAVIAYASTELSASTINGFTTGADKIALVGSAWGVFTFSEGAGYPGAETGEPSVFYNETTGVLSYDSGTGNGPEVIAMLSGAPGLAASDVLSAAVTTGTSGAAGSDGASLGLSGKAGAAGTASVATKTSPVGGSLDILSEAVGGDGGFGGNGASGTKIGGAAGAGGAGGHAQATATDAGDKLGSAVDVDAIATGGSGGAAGISGGTVQDPTTPNGVGANGGAGAAASAVSSATSTGDADATSQSYGGVGGVARGAGHTGGVGGNASGTARASASSNASAGVTAIGGTGGNGLGGARGGAGGTASLLNAVTGASQGDALTLSQSAEGGEGGASDGAVSGVGGKASSALTIKDSKSTAVTASSKAQGGNGGDGTDSSGAAKGGTGSAGGAAAASMNIAGDVAGFLTSFPGAIASAVGGNGGAAQLDANAGAGGVATATLAGKVAGLIAQGTGPVGGDTSVLTARAQGGSGGSVVPTSDPDTGLVPGGNGNGGSGGAAKATANGSVATITATSTGTFPYDLTVSAEAFGGNGGASDGIGKTGGAGGAASAASGATTALKAAIADGTYAIGGKGGDGTAGAAGGVGGAAVVTGLASGVGVGGSMTIFERAMGGYGGDSDTGRAGAGGSASVSVSIKASGSLDTSANANGGTGGTSDQGVGGNGGSASIRLTADSTGSGGSASASGTAMGGAGGSGGTGGLGGTATSIVSATGLDATATATAIGGTGSGTAAAASAKSTASGVGGAFAASASSTTQNNMVGALTASASGALDGRTIVSGAKTTNAPSTGNALVSTSYAGIAPVFDKVDQSVAQVSASPSATNVSKVLGKSNAAIVSAFAGTPTYLAIGELGGSYDSKGTSTETVTSSVSLSLDIPNTGQDLTLALYNGTKVGAGTQNLSLTVSVQTANGTSILETIDDPLRFTDGVVDLGSLGSLGGDQPFTLDLSLSETMSAAGGFYGTFLLGTTNPRATNVMTMAATESHSSQNDLAQTLLEAIFGAGIDTSLTAIAAGHMAPIVVAPDTRAHTRVV